MAFPYNPDHRGYSDLESLLRGDFDAGALKLELGGELPPKPKVTWDVQTGHRSLKPAPEPQVRQVPEPVQPVPLRESPVDENTVGKPGYKFSLRGIDPFATRRLAPGEFYAPFRRPAEAPRAKGHASQLLANVNSMADEHKATIDHIMQQCDKVSRMMLLATANALRKSNAASERPMPKMTVRSHIKKELGRLAGLDEVHRLLDAQELDRPENDDILLYCSPEERQTKLQMEDFFLSSVKTFLKNERRHDFDLERVQKRLTLHSKDAEGVLNFAGHEDNGRGAARWIKNTEAVAMGALNKYETGQHKIFSDFAEKLKDTTDYMNKRMGSTGISMGSTGVSFAAPDTTVFLQPEERDMLQSLEMQKKQKEKTVWELKKQLDELIATRKNMDEVAPVSSGNTEAKMGTDQRSRHAESLDEMDEALTSLEEECLGAKKAAEAAGPQLARMVEFMATGQKNLRKLFGDLKITERKQEEARQRLQDLVLPESRQLVYEMAVELLDTTILPVQSSSSAVPASSESHKPDGTTSHLVAASKEASTQHLLAAARRRQQLRQAKEDIEAELERRRQAVTATQAARDAAQEPEKPLQNTGRNLQPSSLPASSTSGNVSELTQLAVQSTSEKLEEEQPTSPKKENQTRSKELGEFAEEAADAVDHDQDSKEEALTALERQVNMLEDSAHIRPASKNSHQGDERSDVSVPPGVPHEPSELEIEIVAHQDHGEHDKYEIHHPAALERHRPHELDSLEDVEDSETETDDVQQDDDADASPRTKMANAMANAMMKVRMTNYLRKAAQDVREEARKAALEISRQQPIETPKLSVTEYAVNLAKAAGLPREEAERLVDMMRLLSQQFLPFVYQTLLDMLSLPLGDQKMALKMLSLGHVDAASPMRSKGDGAKSLGIASLLATQILAMKEEAGLWDERKLQNAFLQTLEMDQDTERHGDLEVPEVPEDDDHGKFLLAYYKRARPSMRGQKRRVMEFQKGKPYMARSVVRMPHKIQSSSEIEREPERPALPAVAGQKMELPTIDLEESLDPEELNLLRRAQSWSMRRRRQDELDVARSEELRKYRRRASRDLDNYDLGFWEEMQEEIRQKKTALFEETQERRREEWSKLGIEDDQSGGEDTLTSQALKVHGKFTFGGGKQKVPGQKSPSGHPGESSKLSLLPPRKMAEIAVDEASVRLRMNLMLFPQIPGDSPESNLGLPSQQSLNGPSRPPPLAPAPKPNEDAAHAATQAAQAQAAQLAAQQAALWKPKGLPSGAAIFQPHGQLRFKDGRSHKPDGVTSHLAAASKVVFNQHLMAAARRRRLLRQDEGFEAELVRRAEELPTSPKKERLTRLKAFTARKRQVNRLAIAARMRAPSRNNQGEETSDVNVPPRAPHEPTLEQTLTHQDHGKLLLAYHRRAQPSMRGQKRRVLKPYMERSVARAPLKIQSSSEIEREPERPALPAVAVEKAELQTSDLEESLHPEELGLLRPAQSWSRRPRRQDEDVARPDQLQYRTILDNSPTWKRISSSKDREEMQEEIRQKKTALFEEIRERRPEEWSKLGIEDDQSGGEDTLTSQILKMHGKFTFGGGKQKVSGQKSSKGHPGASPKLSLLPPRKMAEIPVDEACARLRMNLMLFHRSRGESPERNLGLPSLPSLPSLNGSPRPPRLVPAPKPNEDAAHAATQAAQAAQEAAVWKPKGLPVMPQFSSLKGGYAPKTEGFSRLPHTARPALERTEMDSNDVNQKAREMLHYLQRFDKAPLQRLLSSREGTRSKLETRRSMDAKQAKPTEHLPPIQKEGARSVSAQAAAWATFLEERLGRHLRTLSKSTPPPQRVTGREIRSLLLD